MDALKLAKQALNEAKAMNDAAKNSDWQKVDKIQKQHESTVNQIAILEVPSSIAASVRTLLLDTRTLNTETEQLANNHKVTLVEEKQTMTKANKMQKALDAFK